MTPTVLVVVGAFLASTVEMVEALTIVLAVGITRGWRSTLLGAAAAVATLAVVVAALGPALTEIPLAALRIVVGAVLLVFGLQWLRKAILRAAGIRARHDEDAIFAREVDEARRGAPGTRARLDWYAFTLAFKGVLLEGLEVALIVVTFGSSGGHYGLAAAGAAGAVVVVAGIGAFVHAPLSRVPENSLKFAVGIMLTSFGVFYGAEGAGIVWPGSDLALLGVIAFFAVVSGLLVAELHGRAADPAGSVSTVA